MARGFLYTQIIEEIEDDESRHIVRVQRRRIRDYHNPLDMPDSTFYSYFRLSKDLYIHLCELLRPIMRHRRHSTGIRHELKILTALNFYATGSYQKPVGQGQWTSMAQPTVSKSIKEVTSALNSLMEDFIHFPTEMAMREIIKQGFYRKYQFPGVIGCIDGTHVAIVRPQEHEERYLNRKGYHSLNVQIICDSNLKIINVNAQFGGSSHDSHVWRMCMAQRALTAIQNETCWLLGDSGYALKNNLLTPILNAIPDTPEEYYTQMHVKVRNCVERCIGVLKARWRCLLKHRVLHYNPVYAGQIVNACVVLHNMAINGNLNEYLEDSFHNPEEIANEAQPEDLGHDEGREVRQRIVQQIWNNRELF